jgi:trehalose 2-sulfotransferase
VRSPGGDRKSQRASRLIARGAKGFLPVAQEPGGFDRKPVYRLRMGMPRCYLICANARCGSTLLSRALSDTGLAGHPDEYFVTGPPEAFSPGSTFWEDGPLALQHGVHGREEFLRLVYRVGSTPNGVFGAKPMWNYVPWAIEKFQELPRFRRSSLVEIFAAAFPGLRIVHVVRRDRLRQAISWLRAAEEEVWVVSEDEPARPVREPVFQYEVIAGMMDLIARGEQAWVDLYKDLGVRPLEVVYEDLTSPEGYELTLRRVLRHLGLDDSIEIPRPSTHRQADDVNDEWVDRFSQANPTT